VLFQEYGKAHERQKAKDGVIDLCFELCVHGTESWQVVFRPDIVESLRIRIGARSGGVNNCSRNRNRNPVELGQAEEPKHIDFGEKTN
jgi:hypothetical protein